MSEGANKSFLADPLGFLNANIVVPHNTLQSVALGQPKIIKVNLEPGWRGMNYDQRRLWCLSSRGPRRATTLAT